MGVQVPLRAPPLSLAVSVTSHHPPGSLLVVFPPLRTGERGRNSSAPAPRDGPLVGGREDGVAAEHAGRFPSRKLEKHTSGYKPLYLARKTNPCYSFNQKPTMRPTIPQAQCFSVGLDFFLTMMMSETPPKRMLTITCIPSLTLSCSNAKGLVEMSAVMGGGVNALDEVEEALSFGMGITLLTAICFPSISSALCLPVKTMLCLSDSALPLRGLAMASSLSLS